VSFARKSFRENILYLWLCLSWRCHLIRDRLGKEKCHRFVIMWCYWLLYYKEHSSGKMGKQLLRSGPTPLPHSRIFPQLANRIEWRHTTRWYFLARLSTLGITCWCGRRALQCWLLAPPRWRQTTEFAWWTDTTWRSATCRHRTLATTPVRLQFCSQ